jgi:hypothetical protein
LAPKKKILIRPCTLNSSRLTAAGHGTRQKGSPEGEDFMFFGYVIGFEAEWGYFVLSELQSIRGRFNLPVERDRFFTPTPVSTILKRFPSREE